MKILKSPRLDSPRNRRARPYLKGTGNFMRYTGINDLHLRLDSSNP